MSGQGKRKVMVSYMIRIIISVIVWNLVIKLFVLHFSIKINHLKDFLLNPVWYKIFS